MLPHDYQAQLDALPYSEAWSTTLYRIMVQYSDKTLEGDEKTGEPYPPEHPIHLAYSHAVLANMAYSEKHKEAIKIYWQEKSRAAHATT